jgi:chromosome condensin MukBEF MukE localization factor
MKKSTILFLEVGMLLGIAASLFLVPDDTSLVTFCIVSGAALLIGNVFCFLS